MSAKKPKLTIDGCVDLVSKMAQDYLEFTTSDGAIPNKLTYKIAMREEPAKIERSARKVAMEQFQTTNKPLMKFAFDTRRIDQENDRNPRSNLQYWHRSQEFITDEQQKKINVFSKVLLTLEELKKSFGRVPEWHDSYARVLLDKVVNTLRIKQGDSDIFGPQLAYLEQLMYARYRITMDEIEKIGSEDLKKVILAKDEVLTKRGIFFNSMDDKQVKDGNNAVAATNTASAVVPTSIVIDGSKIPTTQEAIVNAIFGKDSLTRKDGERTVERTITITIRDEALE